MHTCHWIAQLDAQGEEADRIRRPPSPHQASKDRHGCPRGMRPRESGGRFLASRLDAGCWSGHKASSFSSWDNGDQSWPARVMFLYHNRIESLENILAWGCKHDPANESCIQKSTAVQNFMQIPKSPKTFL